MRMPAGDPGAVILGRRVCKSAKDLRPLSVDLMLGRAPVVASLAEMQPLIRGVLFVENANPQTPLFQRRGAEALGSKFVSDYCPLKIRAAPLKNNRKYIDSCVFYRQVTPQ
jgi:hypothetical protein